MTAPAISAVPRARYRGEVLLHRLVAGEFRALGARQFRGNAGSPDLQTDGFALDLQAGDLRRMQGGKLLWQHGAEGPDPLIGTVKRMTATATELPVLCEFLPEGVDPLADQICRKLKSGAPYGLSLGFVVTEWEWLPGKKGRRATQWEAVELSVVVIPMDSKAIITERAAAQFRRTSQMAQSLQRAREVASLIGERNRAALEAHARGDMSGLHRQLRAIDSHIDTLATAHDQLARELGDDPTEHDKFANPSASMGAQVSAGQAARDFELRQLEARILATDAK